MGRGVGGLNYWMMRVVENSPLRPGAAKHVHPIVVEDLDHVAQLHLAFVLRLLVLISWVADATGRWRRWWAAAVRKPRLARLSRKGPRDPQSAQIWLLGAHHLTKRAMTVDGISGNILLPSIFLCSSTFNLQPTQPLPSTDSQSVRYL